MIAAGIRIAVLHGEERLANLEVTSDSDVVADHPVGDVLAATTQRWAEHGLYPIILWPYDVGGTGSIFLANEDATEGVQIDVLHDVEGRGQYGFKSEALLEHTVQGQAFPRLDEDATRLYLARKRQVKDGETPRESGFGELARLLLSPAAARSLLEPGPTRRRGLSLSRVRRLYTRVARPVGAWIHIVADDPETSSQVASVIATRMSRFLPHVASASLKPFPARIWLWARRIVPVRWRAGVFITWATPGRSAPVGCDIVMSDATDRDTTAKSVVQALKARLPG